MASAGTVISIHLPPPVIMESTADRALVTHMLYWSWAICFSTAASSENDQGILNGFEHCVEGADEPIQRRRQMPIHRVFDPALDIGNEAPGIALISGPVRGFSDDAKF